MADRYPTYFGPAPAGPVADSEAFSAQQLVQIQARRIEQNLARCGPSAWPEQRRFATIYPSAKPPVFLPRTHTVNGVVVVIVS